MSLKMRQATEPLSLSYSLHKGLQRNNLPSDYDSRCTLAKLNQGAEMSDCCGQLIADNLNVLTTGNE